MFNPKGNTTKWLALLVLCFIFTACGPSQYAKDNPDSIIVQALQNNSVSPEQVARKMAGVINIEIQLGDISYDDFFLFLDTQEARLSYLSYADAAGLLQFYAEKLIKENSANTITKAALIAYYLFEPDLADMLKIDTTIGQADAKVLKDLISYLRQHVKAPYMPIAAFDDLMRTHCPGCENDPPQRSVP